MLKFLERREMYRVTKSGDIQKRLGTVWGRNQSDAYNRAIAIFGNQVGVVYIATKLKG